MDGPRPNFYHSSPQFGDDTRIWTALHNTDYFPDSEILICPILAARPSVYSHAETYTTTEWFKNAGDWYGGWDWDLTPQAAGHSVDNIMINGMYCWTANYRSRGGLEMQYINGEPPWPKTYEQCTGSRAFTFHLFWSSRFNYDMDQVNIYPG